MFGSMESRNLKFNDFIVNHLICFICFMMI